MLSPSRSVLPSEWQPWRTGPRSQLQDLTFPRPKWNAKGERKETKRQQVKMGRVTPPPSLRPSGLKRESLRETRFRSRGPRWKEHGQRDSAEAPAGTRVLRPLLRVQGIVCSHPMARISPQSPKKTRGKKSCKASRGSSGHYAERKNKEREERKKGSKWILSNQDFPTTQLSGCCQSRHLWPEVRAEFTPESWGTSCHMPMGGRVLPSHHVSPQIMFPGGLCFLNVLNHGSHKQIHFCKLWKKQ